MSSISDEIRTQYILFIALSINLITAIASLLCSYLILRIIHTNGKWTGFLLLIYYMTISQIIYDITFFPLNFFYYMPMFNNNIPLVLMTFTTSFGGLSVTLWTNAMNFSVFRIVTDLRSVNVLKNFKYYLFFSIGPALLFAIINTGFTITSIYDYHKTISDQAINLCDLFYFGFRLVSIAINIFAYFLIESKISNMGYKKDEPVVALSRRLLYYPVIQLAARLIPSIYELTYGYSSVGYVTHPNVFQQLILFIISFCFPSLGIGFFIIFLKFQPFAKTLLIKKWKYYLFPYCYKNISYPHDPDDSIIVSMMERSAHISGVSEMSPSSFDSSFNNLELTFSESECEEESTDSYVSKNIKSFNKIGSKHGSSNTQLTAALVSKPDTKEVNEYDLMDDEELEKELENRYQQKQSYK